MPQPQEEPGAKGQAAPAGWSSKGARLCGALRALAPPVRWSSESHRGRPWGEPGVVPGTHTALQAPGRGAQLARYLAARQPQVETPAGEAVLLWDLAVTSALFLRGLSPSSPRPAQVEDPRSG